MKSLEIWKLSLQCYPLIFENTLTELNTSFVRNIKKKISYNDDDALKSEHDLWKLRFLCLESWVQGSGFKVKSSD